MKTLMVLVALLTFSTTAVLAHGTGVHCHQHGVYAYHCH